MRCKCLQRACILPMTTIGAMIEKDIIAMRDDDKKPDEIEDDITMQTLQEDHPLIMYQLLKYWADKMHDAEFEGRWRQCIRSK